MAKRPDMQVVGGKIAHLRREKGLCAAAFAREIEQPTWLVMLFNLQVTQLQQNGQEEPAKQLHQQFRKLLRQHIACWKEKLGVTDPALEESASA